MKPTVEPYAADLYAQLAPVADQDEALDWPLLKYLAAIAEMFQAIEDWARDNPDSGWPGWAIIMDPDTTPPAALGWLAQFVGVGLHEGLSDAAQRARIKSTDGFHRGTADALVGAARQYLTGAQTVILRERDTDPYKLTVITYTSETPDSAAVLAALMAQKPAGLLLTYRVLTGEDYTLLRSTYASYTAVRSAFATYDAVRAH